MSKGVKILLAIATVFVVLLITSGAVLAASVVRAGTFRLNIQEAGVDGTNVSLVLPAAVVHLGLDVLPWVLDEPLSAEIRTDLGDYGPAVAAALLELEDAPDAVLVDVRDATERVRIAKEGRSLKISVQDASGSYEITLPASLLGRIARQVA